MASSLFPIVTEGQNPILASRQSSWGIGPGRSYFKRADLATREALLLRNRFLERLEPLLSELNDLSEVGDSYPLSRRVSGSYFCTSIVPDCVRVVTTMLSLFTYFIDTCYTSSLHIFGFF
jgi:hypothetical protein